MNSWIIDSSTKRRDKLFIIAEIMDIAKSGALKTQIMYRANLSFAQLGEYLRLLQKIDLLDKTVVNGKELYTATKKGLDFLQRHNEIMDLLSDSANGKNGAKVPPEALLKY